MFDPVEQEPVEIFGLSAEFSGYPALITPDRHLQKYTYDSCNTHTRDLCSFADISARKLWIRAHPNLQRLMKPY